MRAGLDFRQPRSQGLFPGLGAGKGSGNEVGLKIDRKRDLFKTES